MEAQSVLSHLQVKNIHLVVLNLNDNDISVFEKAIKVLEQDEAEISLLKTVAHYLRQIIDEVNHGKMTQRDNPKDMRVTGQQQRITMEGGDFIVEWDGYEWFKKYRIDKVSVWSKEKNGMTTIEEKRTLPREEEKTKGGYYLDHGEMVDLNKPTDREAILEILNIMIDTTCNRGWRRANETEVRAKALKVKLAGK